MKSLDPKENSLWFISAMGVAQICSWGTLFYGFPLIAAAMQADLGWSKPALYGAATIGMLLGGLAAYPVGTAIDRGLGRYLMSGASVVAALLYVIWSQVDTVVPFYLVLAVLGLMQAATLYDPAFAVIARRFGPARARSGITTLTLWGGFASTVFIPIIQFTIDIYGWRSALLMMAAVNFFICGGLYFLVINPKRDEAVHLPQPGATASSTGRGAVRAAMRLPSYWGLMVAWISYAIAISTLTYHFFPLLVERGLSSAGAVAVLSVIGPAQVAGRVVVVAFGGRAPIRIVGSVTVIVFPLAILCFAFAPPEVLMLSAVACVYGAANGIATILRGTSVPEMISNTHYGAINGSLVGPMNMTTALVPLGAAFLWEATGSYDAVLVAMFLGSLCLCAGFWFAAAKSRR